MKTPSRKLKDHKAIYGFLNVDLEIESSANLSALAAELGDQIVVLYNGPSPKGRLLSLEIGSDYKGPDATIHAICSLIEKLSPKSRRLWDSSRRKVFDIGYEAAPDKRCSNFALRTATLRRVAELGATLAVSIYHETSPV